MRRILTREFHEGLQGIIAADLLHVDLLQCIVAELIELDELVLHRDSPDHQESHDRNDNNSCCHTVKVYLSTNITIPPEFSILYTYKYASVFPWAEDGRAEADDGGAVADGNAPVIGHADGELIEVLKIREFLPKGIE